MYSKNFKKKCLLEIFLNADSLHCTVNAVHLNVADEFVAAVASAVDAQRAHAVSGDRTRAYGTVE